MIHYAPNTIKETYLKLENDHGKNLELKIIWGNYYLNVAKGIWDKKKKEPVMRTGHSWRRIQRECSPLPWFINTAIFSLYGICAMMRKRSSKNIHIEINETGSGSG